MSRARPRARAGRLHISVVRQPLRRTYGDLFSGNSGLVQNAATLYQSAAGILGSSAAPPSHVPRTRHATPALRYANDVPSIPSAAYAGISCHVRAEKPSRRRDAASPVAFARAKDPEIANPHPWTGARSVSSRKVPVRRRIETPGVFAAIAYAASHAARTSLDTVPGAGACFCGAAPAKVFGTTGRTNSEAAKKIRQQT